MVRSPLKRSLLSPLAPLLPAMRKLSCEKQLQVQPDPEVVGAADVAGDGAEEADGAGHRRRGEARVEVVVALRLAVAFEPGHLRLDGLARLGGRQRLIVRHEDVVADASECGGVVVVRGVAGGGDAGGGVAGLVGSLNPGSSAGCADANEGNSSVKAKTRKDRFIVTLPASLTGAFPACPTVAARSRRCQFARL